MFFVSLMSPRRTAAGEPPPKLRRDAAVAVPITPPSLAPGPTTASTSALGPTAPIVSAGMEASGAAASAGPADQLEAGGAVSTAPL